MKKLMLLGISMFVLTLPPATLGAVLFSNLSQASSGTASGIATTNQLVATDFLTGSSASNITGITMRVQNNDTIGHYYTILLYSDLSGAPDPNGLLGTLGLASNTVGAGSTGLIGYSFFNFNLAANTRYWLALGIVEDSVLHSSAFVETASNAADVGSIFTNSTPPNIYNSSDYGVSWAATSSAQNGQFSLEGILVPEPGRASFLLVGCLVMILRRHRMA